MKARCAFCADQFVVRRKGQMYCSQNCCASASYHRVTKVREWRANQRRLLIKAGLPVPARLQEAVI